jgi:hypothetical protein
VTHEDAHSGRALPASPALARHLEGRTSEEGSLGGSDSSKDLGAFLSRAPTGVAYADQTHDQVRQPSVGHLVSSPPIAASLSSQLDISFSCRGFGPR